MKDGHREDRAQGEDFFAIAFEEMRVRADYGLAVGLVLLTLAFCVLAAASK